MQKYVPVPKVALLPAILGGLYSSTATTVVLAKRQREVGPARSDLVAGSRRNRGYVRPPRRRHSSLQCAASLILAPALGALFVLGAGLAAYEWRSTAEQQHRTNLSLPAANPLQIPTAFIFAAIFVVISVATSWIRATFGQTGVLVMAAAVGATDIDPFVINIAQGGVIDLSITTLSAAILIAVSSNNIAKAMYAIVFGGIASSRRPALVLVVLAVIRLAAAAVYILPAQS